MRGIAHQPGRQEPHRLNIRSFSLVLLCGPAVYAVQLLIFLLRFGRIDAETVLQGLVFVPAGWLMALPVAFAAFVAVGVFGARPALIAGRHGDGRACWAARGYCLWRPAHAGGGHGGLCPHPAGRPGLNRSSVLRFPGIAPAGDQRQQRNRQKIGAV